MDVAEEINPLQNNPSSFLGLFFFYRLIKQLNSF
jgi:hypothetical protein